MLETIKKGREGIMRANINCWHSRMITPYVNGADAKHLDIMEADEETGEMLLAYKDADGKYISEEKAEKGALICDGIKVTRLKAEVKLELDATNIDEHFRERIEETFTPLVVTIKNA